MELTLHLPSHRCPCGGQPPTDPEHKNIVRVIRFRGSEQSVTFCYDKSFAEEVLGLEERGMHDEAIEKFRTGPCITTIARIVPKKTIRTITSNGERLHFAEMEVRGLWLGYYFPSQPETVYVFTPYSVNVSAGGRGTSI